MRISKSLQERINKAVSEKIDIVPYDLAWPKRFESEAKFLKKKFPKVIKRIEHFGSTAVPGLAAKPIVDMLVEVESLKEVKKEIVPILVAGGYDYFWRPALDKPPFYAWFIKRDKKGNRTHHIHMVEARSPLWKRIYFRDYLREFPQEAKAYGDLKSKLAKSHPNNREAYTKAKTDFVSKLTQKAEKYYRGR